MEVLERTFMPKIKIISWKSDGSTYENYRYN